MNKWGVLYAQVTQGGSYDTIGAVIRPQPTELCPNNPHVGPFLQAVDAFEQHCRLQNIELGSKVNKWGIIHVQVTQLVHLIPFVQF